MTRAGRRAREEERQEWEPLILLVACQRFLAAGADNKENVRMLVRVSLERNGVDSSQHWFRGEAGRPHESRACEPPLFCCSWASSVTRDH